jgi:hypothetical protein
MALSSKVITLCLVGGGIASIGLCVSSCDDDSDGRGSTRSTRSRSSWWGGSSSGSSYRTGSSGSGSSGSSYTSSGTSRGGFGSTGHSSSGGS